MASWVSECPMSDAPLAIGRGRGIARVLNATTPADMETAFVLASVDPGTSDGLVDPGLKGGDSLLHGPAPGGRFGLLGMAVDDSRRGESLRAYLMMVIGMIQKDQEAARAARQIGLLDIRAQEDSGVKPGRFSSAMMGPLTLSPEMIAKVIKRGVVSRAQRIVSDMSVAQKGSSGKGAVTTGPLTASLLGAGRLVGQHNISSFARSKFVPLVRSDLVDPSAHENDCDVGGGDAGDDEDGSGDGDGDTGCQEAKTNKRQRVGAV